MLLAMEFLNTQNIEEETVNKNGMRKNVCRVKQY